MANNTRDTFGHNSYWLVRVQCLLLSRVYNVKREYRTPISTVETLSKVTRHTSEKYDK